MGLLNYLSQRVYNIFNRKSKHMERMIPKYIFYISKIDDEGKIIPEEHPVYANSEQELRSIYAMTGDRITIQGQQLNPKYVTKNKATQPTPTQKQTEQKVDEEKVVADEEVPVVPQIIDTTYTEKKVVVPEAQEQIPHGTMPEKIYTVGNERYKVDTLSGKFYVEKWVEVNEDDPKIRVMYDSGKPVALNGKHLEILKWVEVKNEEEH